MRTAFPAERAHPIELRPRGARLAVRPSLPRPGGAISRLGQPSVEGAQLGMAASVPCGESNPVSPGQGAPHLQGFTAVLGQFGVLRIRSSTADGSRVRAVSPSLAVPFYQR